MALRYLVAFAATSAATTSVPELQAGDDSCEYANDEFCDPPFLCPDNSDCSDCDSCDGLPDPSQPHWVCDGSAENCEDPLMCSPDGQRRVTCCSEDECRDWEHIGDVGRTLPDAACSAPRPGEQCEPVDWVWACSATRGSGWDYDYLRSSGSALSVEACELSCEALADWDSEGEERRERLAYCVPAQALDTHATQSDLDDALERGPNDLYRGGLYWTEQLSTTTHRCGTCKPDTCDSAAVHVTDRLAQGLGAGAPPSLLDRMARFWPRTSAVCHPLFEAVLDTERDCPGVQLRLAQDPFLRSAFVGQRRLQLAEHLPEGCAALDESETAKALPPDACYARPYDFGTDCDDCTARLVAALNGLSQSGCFTEVAVLALRAVGARPTVPELLSSLGGLATIVERAAALRLACTRDAEAACGDLVEWPKAERLWHGYSPTGVVVEAPFCPQPRGCCAASYLAYAEETQVASARLLADLVQATGAEDPQGCYAALPKALAAMHEAAREQCLPGVLACPALEDSYELPAALKGPLPRVSVPDQETEWNGVSSAAAALAVFLPLWA